MRTAKLFLPALAAALIACEQPAPIASSTQVLVSVSSTDSELLSSVTDLRVRASLRLGPNSWRKAVSTTVTARGGIWPVDIPVVPRDASETGSQFEVVAEALANGRVVAETRAITGFERGKLLALSLHFFACPGPGPVCSPGCLGLDCDVCTEAQTCDRVPVIDPSDLIETSSVDTDVDPSGGLSSDTPPALAADGSEPDGAGFDASVGSGRDAGPGDPAAMGPTALSDGGPAPECSPTAACPAGFTCTQMKCVSLCTQTQCDPNATCSLLEEAPICTCNRGYIASGSGTSVMCTRDTSCEQLGCDVNAGCQMATNGARECVCKNGYAGTGMSCTPVSCPQPTIIDGTVSTPDGLTFGKTATYRCDTGYTEGSGTWVRTCGADMQWSGTQPSCKEITCPAPPIVANATVSTAQGRAYGDRAIYQCHSGYAIQGSAELTCTQTGWVGTPPQCRSTCGNNVRDVGELCDPTAPGSSAWTCSPTCQSENRMAYRPCGAAAECDTGQSCNSGYCTNSCTSETECPVPPLGTGTTAVCLPVICAARCNTNANCAPGLVCGANGFCKGCDSTDFCPAGRTCQMYTPAGVGRCI